jgi:hypothetical protein
VKKSKKRKEKYEEINNGIENYGWKTTPLIVITIGARGDAQYVIK